MKKSVLAVAVAALVASGATSAATVYDKDGTTLAIGGRVEALFFSTHDSGTHSDSVIRDRARLNIGGRTKITDGFTGYGFAEWEWNHKGDDTEATDSRMRYAYVGLDMGQFGDIRIGRWEQAMDYVTNVTDHFEEHGCNSLLGDNRSSGQIGYEWKGYGVTAGIRLQTAIDNYNSDAVSFGKKVASAVGDFGDFTGYDDGPNVDFGVGVYAGYRSPDVLFGPIDFRVGFQYTKFQDKDDGYTTNKTNEVDLTGGSKLSEIYSLEISNEKVIAAGLSWGTYTKGPYIALSYNYGKVKGVDAYYTLKVDNTSVTEKTMEDLDIKIHGFEAMLSYGFDCGVVLNAGYHYLKVKGEYEDLSESRKMKYVQFNAIYNINPNFRVWAEAHIDCDSDDGIGYITNSKGEAENAYLVGVRYTF